MYSILRVAKIKSFGELKGYQSHVNREKKTFNADEEKTPLNFTLRGNSEDIAGTLKAFLKDKNIEVMGQGTKNQSVLATEILLTASPEFFLNSKGEIDQDKTTKWIMENDAWLKEKYKDSYIFGKAHLDESSPHVSAIVCATSYHQKWKKEILAHKAWFGKDNKKNRLRDLQTEYAKTMQQAGFKELQRGKEKSKAQHKDVQSFYADINKTKEKVEEALEEKESIIKQLNQDLSNTKITATKEIQARNTIINSLAEHYKINNKDLEKAYNKAKSDLDKDNTKELQKSDNTKELQLGYNTTVTQKNNDAGVEK